ncbi:MAG TPA: cupin domain-containing protein [Stellaceae bacterium]|nr:cupin domain-containing protein [Stellaceae bacterium]
MKPILNIRDAESRQVTNGDAFEARVAPLAERLGGARIGANVTTVSPGKAAYPLHHHFGNEEHFFVISGRGTLRFGDTTYPVAPGDYIVTPPGGPGLAHQLVNTGADDLVYLALSTMTLPEVVGYPDSGKTGVRAEPTAGSRFLIDDAARNALSYYDREDGAPIRELTRK